MTRIKEPHHLELFIGGVPPFASLNVSFWEIGQILEKVEDVKEDGEVVYSPAAGTCIIALTAHLEAYCKSLFAAAINICPSILKQFTAKRPDASILIADLAHVDFDLCRHVGFLVVEKLDLGTPRSINGLYFDLLGITPLSKDDAEKYRELIELRNLLVHHGGVYTFAYAKQHGLPHTDEFELYHQGPSLRSVDVIEWQIRVGCWAEKMSRAVHKALNKALRSCSSVRPFQRKALNYIMIDIDRGWRRAATDMKAFKTMKKA